nr:hypothetical protein [Tanacetum cinerariifolium]
MKKFVKPKKIYLSRFKPFWKHSFAYLLKKSHISYSKHGKKIAIQYSKPENPNELFQKLLEDLKELVEYEKSQSRDRPIFLNNDADHSDQNKECFENSSDEIVTSNSNEEKEGPSQDSDIRKLIREECCIKVCEEQKQSMEDTMLELVKICRQKELLCIHDNINDLIESDLNTKLLSINSQRLDKEKQEVKNVVEQPAERGNRIVSLQNFRVIHKSFISLNTSQISSIHAVATILSIKEPEYSPSMGYENSNTTPKMKSDKIIKSGVEELVPILSENEVTLEDKRECDVPISVNSPICDDHSEIFSDSNNNDDISSDDDNFEDIEYVEGSLSNPEIVSVEEENVVHQEEEEVDLKDVFQIQDVVLREKLLNITRLISNIESLNDNPTPDLVLNSSVSISIFEESDNSLSDNFSPEFENFCDHTKETRSGNTTTHVDNSLPEYDLFFFEIEPDQERLINVVKSNISDELSNDSLLEEADFFLAFDNLIPSGIENFADEPEGDVYFLEELLIDNSILSHESTDSNVEDNPSIPLPPPEPPDGENDAGEEILVAMNNKDKFDEDYYFFIFDKVFSLLSAESEDTVFDPEYDVPRALLHNIPAEDTRERPLNMSFENFRNGDCETESQSDNTIDSPHGFIIHGIKVLKCNEKVTEVIDVENERIDNSRLLRWIVSLFEWNSSVSSMKSLIQGTFSLLMFPISGKAYRKALKCAYVDADHAGYQDNRRSTSGSAQFLDFIAPPSKEELVTFIQELGYSGKCNMLSAIHTNQMHQPWRTFAAIINSEDESDDINNDVNANEDDSGNEDDDGNDAHDSERTDSDDDDENPSFTLKDHDEEEHDEEYEAGDDYENVYGKEDDDLYKDVDVRSLRAKGNKIESSKQSFSISSDFASKFLILDNVPPVVNEVASIMNVKNHEDKDEDPPAGSNQGLKKRKTSKDEELVFEAADTDMQQDQGSKFGHTVDKADSEVIPKSDWLKKPNKPPTPNYTWNDGKSIDFRPPQK